MLTKADVFDVLAVTRRRSIIRLVAANGDTLEARDLVEQIAAAEDGKPVSEVRHDDGTRASVYNTVTRSHLPLLADLGVVEYDPDHKQVRRAQHFETVAGVLQAADAAMNSAVEADPIEAVIQEQEGSDE